MCSEFFRIPLDWLNRPLAGGLGVGMVVAMLLLAIGVAAILWARRGNRAGDAWAFLPSLLLLAAAVAVVPRWFPAGLPIRGYGTMVLLGSLTGLWMATRRARQIQLHPDVIYSLAFGMFICGIVGARLFFVIEYWESRFRFDRWQDTLLAVVKFTEGGLVIYGSLIGATLAFLVFTLRHRLPPLAMADLIAPSLLAGLALGRSGCLLNGCCDGGESSLPWAVTFPPGSPLYLEQVGTGRMLGFLLKSGNADDPRPLVATVDVDSPANQAGLSPGLRISRINDQAIKSLRHAEETLFVELGELETVRVTTAAGADHTIAIPPPPSQSKPVHPTQVYSAIHAVLLAWVLWSFYPFRRRDGEVTALMLTVYPVSRFLLEMIRVDESAVFGTGLSLSQNISIVLLVGAVAMWIYLSLKPHQRAVFGSAAA